MLVTTSGRRRHFEYAQHSDVEGWSATRRVPACTGTPRAWTEEELLDLSHAEPNTGCFMWMGAQQRGQYGSVRDRRTGKARGAHQLMYEIRHGLIPPGMLVMHKCDNPPCINPAHLTTGTHKDNSDDKVAKGRDRNRGERHHGAKLTDEAVRMLRTLPRPIRTTTLDEMASAHRVSRKAVEQVVYGQNWRHVTPDAEPPEPGSEG